MDELTPRVRDALGEHARSRQLDLSSVRIWLTHSENPPARAGLAKMLRRRANPADLDAEHDTAIVLHPTYLIIVTDGPKRGTAALSVSLVQASIAAGTGLGARFDSVAGESDGFTVTGFAGEQGGPGSYYVGLGPDPAARECFDAVESAIVTAKNPRGV